MSNIRSFKLLALNNVASMQLFIDEIDNAIKHYTKARVIIFRLQTKYVINILESLK